MATDDDREAINRLKIRIAAESDGTLQSRQSRINSQVRRYDSYNAPTGSHALTDIADGTREAWQQGIIGTRQPAAGDVLRSYEWNVPVSLEADWRNERRSPADESGPKDDREDPQGPKPGDSDPGLPGNPSGFDPGLPTNNPDTFDPPLESPGDGSLPYSDPAIPPGFGDVGSGGGGFVSPTSPNIARPIFGTPSTPPPPPFIGGQCPTAYTATFQVIADSNDQGPSPQSPPSPEVVTAIGPVTVVPAQINSSIRGFKLTNPSGTNFSTRYIDSNPVGLRYTLSLVRQDSQPDNCGNPSAPLYS